MEKVKIQIKKGAYKNPFYATPQAAGADIYSSDGDIILFPGDRILVHTGIYIALPEGYEAQIRPRSGLANKHGITVLNSPGTIDADYRGEVCVILINHGHKEYRFSSGERIAQMVIKRDVVQAEWEEVDELPTTERGEGGFGHTGKN